MASELTWNERAALAMGWEIREGKMCSDEEYRYGGFFYRVFGEIWLATHEDGDDQQWHPTVSYDDAMMLRDECAKRGLKAEYMRELWNVMGATDPEPFTDFASAAQICEAATLTIEQAALEKGAGE